MRLGGIFHAARAFSALGVDFSIAYYAPDYLDDDINYWALYLQTKGCYKLGRITHAPNVMLIRESTEAGDQGYYNILKDQAEYLDTNSLDKILRVVNPTDVLLFPGRYNNHNVMKHVEHSPCRLHIDIHYDSEGLLDDVARGIDTLFLSTSSAIFSKYCRGAYSELIKHYGRSNVKCYVIKENRGGSVCYIPQENTQFASAAYYVPAMHSVGVGDVYDSVFVSGIVEDEVSKKMSLAALCAAKYAETMDFCKFKSNMQLIIENSGDLYTLKGTRLPWQERKDMNIYLAAPDFPDVDTKLLDDLFNSLCYHNFSPRRPIKENGLAYNEMSYENELLLYQEDTNLMDKCILLIAVMLNNDPGTLVELGMFKQTGKHTIIYDPFHYCTNMFVRHTPDYLCGTISDVIDATFLCLGEEYNANI